MHCLITPILIRGHIADYGDISFILQHLISFHPAVGHISCAPSHDGCASSPLDELDVCTYSFPKPGHWPIIWPMFKQHFDTIGTCEVTQCWNMGSKDKISSSAVSLPASKEEMGQVTNQARPALTWGCFRLPWPQRAPLSPAAGALPGSEHGDINYTPWMARKRRMQINIPLETLGSTGLHHL